MALIICSECNKKISDTATACPNCGFVIKQKKKIDYSKFMKSKKNLSIVGISLVVFLVVLSLFSNGGCPKDMSGHDYQIGLKAIEIVDDYLDMEISFDKAHDELDSLKYKLDAQSLDRDDEYYMENFSLGVDLLGLSSAILNDSVMANYDSILERRNDLAKSLNESKR